jgi:FAD/FMN-containing dehydrogenase
MYSEGAGIARVIPAAIAVPRDMDDVVTLVRWARDTGTPIIPRGSGSGMAGGAVGTGVVVDLSRLRDIGPVDRSARRIFVGPGALRDEVDARARESGLRFPVDPSSGAFCTIGGMVSTNAAGARSLRYGATRPWVMALDCVFEDGSRATIRRSQPAPSNVPAVARFAEHVRPRLGGAAKMARPGVLKESSGYAIAEFARSGELVDLLVGSEGTLVVLVGIELALTDVPGATTGLLAAFPSLETAVEGALLAREAGASACELLDRTFLDIALMGDAPLPVGEGTEAVLLGEIEGSTIVEAQEGARALQRAFERVGASTVRVAQTPEDERALWVFRHAASPALTRIDPWLAAMQFIEDGAVPPQNLPAYVRGVRKALSSQGIRGVIFGHAGDAHIHVNPLIDTRVPDWRERAEALLAEVAELTTQLGGTLAGEHGDGRLRTPLLAKSWPPEAVELFAAVKQAFDPAGILNPGVKIPVPGQRAIGDVKYDRSLPPLPSDARAALDGIIRDRGFARFRLSLIDERI